MASVLKVDKLDPQSGTALEIGTSGDTVSIPSGATLDISASTLTPPATMPASSGVNLTALNATNLGSGTVPTARLGTGTASSSTVLYGDQTYKAEPGGAWTLIKTKTASSDAYIDFVDGASGVVFDGTYKMYCIQAINIEVQTNNTEMYVYTSNDGGSSYETSYDALTVRGFNWRTDPTTLNVTSAIAHLGSVGNAGGKACGITLWIPDPADTSTYHYVYGQGFTLDDGGTFRIAAATGGAHETAEAFNAIKFEQSSGNINTGTFSLYGITT